MLSTDTYTRAQGQDEFYFGLPYDKMDIALWSHNHGVPVEQVAAQLSLSLEAASHVYKDIESKRQSTAYLHSTALMVEPVPQILRLDKLVHAP